MDATGSVQAARSGTRQSGQSFVPGRAGAFPMLNRMEIIMSPRSRTLVAAALVFATFGQGVAAQTTDAHHPAKAGDPSAAQVPADPMAAMMQGMMPMMQMMSAMHGQGGMVGMDPAERIEGRIAFLKAELAITDAQDAAWAGFAEALRGYAAGLKSTRMMGMDAASPDLLARLDQSDKQLSVKLDGVRALRAALAPLLEVLSDDQRATAAELLPVQIGLGGMDASMPGMGMMGGMTGGTTGGMMPSAAP